MEETELEQIIVKYENELRFLAYRYVRDWILVDDVMQEVYLKVFLKWKTFNNTSKLKSWLYKITCNQCIDFLRNRVIKTTIIVENLDDFLFFNSKSVEEEVIEDFEKRRLAQNINYLPHDYKKTLTLYYFNNYSYKEISELLCKDISYVKNKLFRGKRLLKNIYHTNELEQGI